MGKIQHINKDIKGKNMTYQEVVQNAKKNIGPHCKVCPNCNGVACKGVIPGPGGKGSGIGFIRNYQAFRGYGLNMDTLHEVSQPDTSVELMGKTFKLPVFAAPVGAVQMHYSDLYDDLSYSTAVVEGCHAAGILAFTGDGVKSEVFDGTATAIKAQNGYGVPTIKPWRKSEVIEKIRTAEAANAVAIAMDIDAAGLAILAAQGKPVSPMSTDTLKEIIASTEKPFIIKGIMTVAAAKKAADAGAYAIIVSNHGGRVLDETPSSLEVLSEIVAAVGDQTIVMLDGGVRSGLDVFKALALGAKALLIARPFVTAVYGGDREGVALYVNQLEAELSNAMLMTGCARIADITVDKLRKL
jgi:L-lactate dehydrogenase (FMN-dependent) and related alpha-hydroxy acid dehydrogenases